MSTSRRMASTPSDRFSLSKTGSAPSSNRPCHSFIWLCCQTGAHGIRKFEQMVRSFGRAVIQAEGRLPAGDRHGSFEQSQGDRSSNRFLGLIEERVQRFAQRTEPAALVNELRVGHRK